MVFWIYLLVFLDLSIRIFGFIRYDFWDYPLGFLFVLGFLDLSVMIFGIIH